MIKKVDPRVLDRLRRVYADGEGLAPKEVRDWTERARLAVAAAYGDPSSSLERFDGIRYSLGMWTDSTPQSSFDRATLGGLKRARTMLAAFVEDLETHLPLESAAPTPYGDAVFLIHGHDHGLLASVARLLERLGLTPVVLHEQADCGKTIIEKFEAHTAEAVFAIALLTADDVGHAASAPAPPVPNRARQNVVLELGYFMGALGRARTLALYEDGVELPSDLKGLLYVSIAGGWEFKVAKELRAAGLPIDMNLV